MARTKKLMSTQEASELLGMSPATFRSAMARARKQGVVLRVEGPDRRTPMWDIDNMLAWLGDRPGKGNWRRPHGKQRRG